MSTIKKFIEEFEKNPKKVIEKSIKFKKDKEKELEEYFNNFLERIKNIISNSNDDLIELKISENGLFISENIEKILKEINLKGWTILNMDDFKLINECKITQKGFLYTNLLDLKIKLRKK